MTTPSAEAWLFYDPGCGPCRFFARVCEWASRSRVRSLSYDGEEARRELIRLDDATWFSYAHLVHVPNRCSGASIMTPLAGWILGSTAERIVAGAPPLDRGLKWVYNRFWNYRRTRGCAARTYGPTS